MTALAGQLYDLRPRLLRSGAENLAAPRQPLRPEVVTHVLGTFRYRCLRAGHQINGGRRSRPRTRLDAKLLETGKIQGIFPKNGSSGRNPRGFIVAKSAPCLTNSLLTGTGNAPAPISENPGSISEAGEAFQRICCEGAFIVVRGKPDP